MTPVWAHNLEGKMLAYVEGWTAAKEHDGNRFELYQLDAATNYLQAMTINGEKTDQKWYLDFGTPTKEAIMQSGGRDQGGTGFLSEQKKMGTRAERMP